MPYRVLEPVLVPLPEIASLTSDDEPEQPPSTEIVDPDTEDIYQQLIDLLAVPLPEDTPEALPATQPLAELYTYEPIEGAEVEASGEVGVEMSSSIPDILTGDDSYPFATQDQSLDQTFVAIERYLMTAPSEVIQIAPQAVATTIVQTSLQAIERALDNQPLLTAESLHNESAPKLTLTPELVDGVLTLLRGLGYRQPGDGLVTFVTSHDLATLYQTLEDLCQLARKHEWREFLPAHLTLTPATDEDATPRHFGRALLDLVRRLSPQQQAA
jgi:hypothetical protein